MMPIYDFECERCGKTFEGVCRISERCSQRCPDCGGKGKVIITKVNQIDKGYPFIHEDLTPDGPVEVKSRKHYKELCKKYGVYAPHIFGQGYNIGEI